MSLWFTGHECPEEQLEEADRYMRELQGTEDVYILLNIDDQGNIVWDHTSAPGTNGILLTPVETLAQQWTALPEKQRPRFPLTPVVKAWLEKPRAVELERRQTGIVPMPTRIMGTGQLELNLGEFWDTPILGEVSLPDNPSHLPGLEPVDDTMVIPPLLLLYDAADLPSKSGGHGAPLSMRVWFESTMAMPIMERDHAGSINLNTREVVSWLWPNGGFKPGRHMAALNRALIAVNHSLIRWRGGYWAAVLVRNFPATPDDTITLLVELPPGSGRGPLIHRTVMRRYGVQSAPLYRAYLAAAYMWDEFGTHGGGFIQATRPTVARDEEGGILDTDGRRITDREGTPVRRWNHPKAIQLGDREPNPAAARYPMLTELDQLRMVNAVGNDQSRAARKEARRTFDKMAEDEVITLEDSLTATGGQTAIRVMPPPGWGPNWMPPEKR